MKSLDKVSPNKSQKTTIDLVNINLIREKRLYLEEWK